MNTLGKRWFENGSWRTRLPFAGMAKLNLLHGHSLVAMEDGTRRSRDPLLPERKR